MKKQFLFVFTLIHSIPEPTPSTMTALHQFGAEMLKLSRGLDAVSSMVAPMAATTNNNNSSTTGVVGTNNKNTSNSIELKKQQTPLLSNHEIMPPPKLTRERNRWVHNSIAYLRCECVYHKFNIYICFDMKPILFHSHLKFSNTRRECVLRIFHKWHSDFISLGYLILFDQTKCNLLLSERIRIRIAHRAFCVGDLWANAVWMQFQNILLPSTTEWMNDRECSKITNTY